MDEDIPIDSELQEEEEIYLEEDDIQKVIDLDDVEELDEEEVAIESAERKDVAASEQANAEVIDVEDDSIATFSKHEDAVLCCDVSNDDKLVVTGGQDDKAFVWRSQAQDLVFTATGHTDSVVAVQFNKPSSLVATGDYGGLIQVWNTNGEREYHFEIDDLNWLIWHPIAENVLLAGTTSGDAWMWKLSKTNPQCKTFYSPGFGNVVAKIFEDGKRIVMGYDNGTIMMYDLKSLELLGSVTGRASHKDSVISLDINPDNTLIASGSTDSTVKIINANNYKVLMTLSCGKESESSDDEVDSVESLAFSTNSLLAVGTVNGYIQVWDISSQTKRNELKLDLGVSKISVSKQNPNILYAGCLDSVFRIIDLRTCEILSNYTGHTNQILDFRVSSDSKYALTCSEDYTCKIFQIAQ